MHTIQIEISDQLATQLSPYRESLPALLEAGLRAWKRKSRQRQSETTAQIRQALIASGKVLSPDFEGAPHDYVRQSPIIIGGQPVSEIAIEQRGAQ